MVSINNRPAMKKIFTILLAVFTICAVSAQSYGVKLHSPKHHKSSEILNRFGNARAAETATKQRLDSIVNEFDKLAFTYDVNGNLLTQTAYERDDATSPWITLRKQTLTYNSKNQLIITMDYGIDDDSGELLLTGKEETTYDTKGNTTLYIGYFWDDATQSYINDQKTEDFYNADNEFISDIEYTYKNNTWVYANKNTFLLDNQKNDTLYVREQWDPKTNKWFPLSKRRSIFNSNNLPTIETNYKFDYIDKQVWLLDYKVENTYDNHLNISTELTSDYDNVNATWVTKYKNDYTYNFNYGLADIVGPNDFYFYSYVNNMITTEIGYSFPGNVATEDMNSAYYYSPVSITGVNDEILGNNNLKVYPNPSSDYISFDSDVSNITITDLQGNIVLNQANSTNGQISVKHLQNGLYIYKLTSHESVSTGKLIKE